jgi:hypothetical protein
MYASSTQQSVSGGLAGSTTSTFPLPGIPEFKKWDQQNGVHGIHNVLSRNVDSKVAGLLHMLNATMGKHPRGHAVFNTLLLASQHHWRSHNTRQTYTIQVYNSVGMLRNPGGMFVKLGKVSATSVTRFGPAVPSARQQRLSTSRMLRSCFGLHFKSTV